MTETNGNTMALAAPFRFTADYGCFGRRWTEAEYVQLLRELKRGRARRHFVMYDRLPPVAGGGVIALGYAGNDEGQRPKSEGGAR